MVDFVNIYFKFFCGFFIFICFNDIFIFVLFFINFGCFFDISDGGINGVEVMVLLVLINYYD